MALRSLAAVGLLASVTTWVTRDAEPPRGVAPEPPDAGAADAGAGERDTTCLRWLVDHGVPHERRDDLPGVRTPIEVTGAVAGLKLVARGRRPPVMDCELARALAEAAPIFAALGIDELGYSSVYDVRTRRGTNILSAHAYGLAIDVHTFGGNGRILDVLRDYEPGVGAWKGLDVEAGDLPACLGQPTTEPGRVLRTLACRLKLHSAFRVIVSPDDDEDHRDHLHLEAFPDNLARVRRMLTGTMRDEPRKPPPDPVRAAPGAPPARKPAVAKRRAARQETRSRTR